MRADSINGTRSNFVLWGGALLLLLTVFAVYFTALAGEFVYDDLLAIQQNPQITSLANIPSLFGSSYWDFVGDQTASHVGYYRPLSMVLATLAYVAGDGDPWIFHALSLFIYALSCIAAWRFAARLLRSEGAGFWAALLFALHPLHVESVAWVSALHDPLFACFGFMALASFLKWRDEGSTGMPWRAAGWMLLSLLSKDAAIALTPVALVCDWGRRHAQPAPLGFVQRWVLGYVPFACVLAAYYLVRVVVFDDPLAGFDRQVTDYGVGATRLALLRVEVLGGAAWLLTWPAELNLFRPFQPELPAGAASLRIGLIGSVIMIALALVAWLRGWRPTLALLLLIPAALSPVLLRVDPLGTFPLSDRFLFVPVLGFTGLLAHLAWTRLPRAGATAMLVLIGAAFAARTIAQLPYWANEEVLFRHAIAQNPRNPTVHWGLGRVLLGKYSQTGLSDHLIEARRSFESSMSLLEEASTTGTDIFATRDDLVQTNLGLGHALMRESEVDQFQNYEIVRKIFEQVIAYQPDNERGYVGLGVAWLASNDPNQAAIAFRKAIQLNPSSPEAHFNMGILLMRINEWTEAAKEFRTCTTLRNNNRKDLVFLARALVESGEEDEALLYANRAHELFPDDPDPLLLKASVAANANRMQEALELFDKAIEISATYGAAHLGRGKTLVALGQRASAEAALATACELLPNSFDAHFNMMVLMLDTQTPQPTLPYYFLAAYRLRPPDYAKRMRDVATAVHQDDVAMLVMLATIDADRADLAQAMVWSKRAMELSPEDGPANYTYGVLLRQLDENPESALAPLQLAAEKLPTSYHAQMDLADLLLQLNREADAKPFLNNALLLLPEQPMEPGLKAKTRETIQTALTKIEQMSVGPLPSDQ